MEDRKSMVEFKTDIIVLIQMKIVTSWINQRERKSISIGLVVQTQNCIHFYLLAHLQKRVEVLPKMSSVSFFISSLLLNYYVFRGYFCTQIADKFILSFKG